MYISFNSSFEATARRPCRTYTQHINNILHVVLCVLSCVVGKLICKRVQALEQPQCERCRTRERASCLAETFGVAPTPAAAAIGHRCGPARHGASLWTERTLVKTLQSRSHLPKSTTMCRRLFICVRL